jgi:hypothetical protein
MDFRERLATQIGIPLRLMAGYWKWPDPFAQALLGVGAEPMPQFIKALPIKWEVLRPDPIFSLLWHSDCEGYLTPKECRAIAPRLRELIRGWPDADYDKVNATMLYHEMRRAARRKRRLAFH